MLGSALYSSEVKVVSVLLHLSGIGRGVMSQAGVQHRMNQDHWHTICREWVMHKSDGQSGQRFADVLPFINSPDSALPAINNPLRFSDASSDPSIDLEDPRHLIAIMTQTRRQCRTHGLIRRDHAELIHIGSTLGLSKFTTSQIIEVVRSIPADSTIEQIDLDRVGLIPVSGFHKKTRIPIRVLVGLSIWAISIAIAMLIAV